MTKHHVLRTSPRGNNTNILAARSHPKLQFPESNFKSEIPTWISRLHWSIVRISCWNQLLNSLKFVESVVEFRWRNDSFCESKHLNSPFANNLFATKYRRFNAATDRWPTKTLTPVVLVPIKIRTPNPKLYIRHFNMRFQTKLIHCWNQLLRFAIKFRWNPLLNSAVGIRYWIAGSERFALRVGA